jgi:hypothetical protein
MTDPFSSETPPIGESGGESTGTPDAEEGAQATPEAREWIAQLQSMINGIATQAAPVAKEIGAKAAELASIAAVKAGPAAQRAAELTTEYGSRFAEKAQSVAADLRTSAAADTASAGNGSTNGSGNGHDVTAETPDPAPEETSGSGV